jgi:hypothetical protein
MRRIALACALVACIGFVPGASAAVGAPAIPTLTVQVVASDEGLVVTEALSAQGGGRVAWSLPLLLPVTGPGPALAPKSDTVRNGVETRGQGGSSVSLEADRIAVTGEAGPGFAAQVRYTLPVTDDRLDLRLSPAMTLGRVQVVTRRSPTYGAQVRPLAPYAVRSETEEDGTWTYLTLLEPLPAGATLKVAASHLPSAFGPYRAAAFAAVALALLALALGLAQGRRKA